MIVFKATFLASIGGSIDKYHYLRSIPQRPGFAVYCLKPQYSKKRKKVMAQRQQVNAFKDYTALAKAAYHDPEQRAFWEQKHNEALKKIKKHGNRYDTTTHRLEVPPRLWDYIRREIAAQQSPQIPEL